MSKVSIEIDGLKFGLRISASAALELIAALQGVWVASRTKKRDLGLLTARSNAHGALDTLLGEISVSEQDIAVDTAEQPLANVIELKTRRT